VSLVEANIYSDNGTNYQDASNELKELYQMLHSKKHQDHVNYILKENHVEWHNFISLHAPYFGGIWEAAIKIAKNHLKRIVGDTDT